MKRLLVVFLEKLCTFIDATVISNLSEKIQMHWYCQLAELSARLDEKWKTGEWN